MEVPNIVLKYGFIALLVLLIVAAIGAAIKKNSYDNELVRLQNEVASRDQTIEVKDGVYQKLALQSDNLKSLLDQKDAQVQALEAQLKKTGDDLLAATTLNVQLKKQLASNGNVTVDPKDPKYPGMVVAKLDSKDDFLPFEVTGSVAVDCSLEQAKPPTASLLLSQRRPLRLSVVVSQGSDKSWRTSTTSSEENFKVDIALAAVNPYVLEPHWYEKIEFSATVAGGQGGAGFGFLAGLGISYKIKQFNVGPAVFVTISDRVDKFFGATVAWRPFEQ